MTRKKARRRIARLLRHVGASFADAVQDARTLIARGRYAPLKSVESICVVEHNGCDCCGPFHRIVGFKGPSGTVTIEALAIASRHDLY